MKYIFIASFFLCISLILFPFIPALLFPLQSPGLHGQYAHFKASVTSEKRIYSDTNTLIIPEIGLSVPIVEGNTDNALWKGAWHLPNTGSPMRSNMVLGGHRFAYLPPHNMTFYHLDQLKEADDIFVIWQKHLYTYEVSTIRVVSSDDVGILKQTKSPELTLFTCTPIWNPIDRLVVSARLVQSSI